ncbi:MAG: ABC transporter substrate-binding protein [Acidimicrobiales bacterium]
MLIRLHRSSHQSGGHRRVRAPAVTLAALGTASLLLAACSSSPATSPSASKPQTITWVANSFTGSGMRDHLIAMFEKAYPKIHIHMVAAPSSTNTDEAQLSTDIGSGASSPDVYMGDVIWPATFGHNHLALPLSNYLPKTFWSRFAPGLVKGASYNGKVYGAPFNMDAGFLYYRKDLLAQAHLPVPTTWEQVMSESKTLQQRHLVKYGFVWQGNSYEGLTCDWMEFASDAGGTVLNSSGTKATIDSPQSLQALNYMRSLITSGVTPAAVTTFEEPQAMDVFAAGQAAFLRNWDYAYGYSNNPKTSSVVGKVGVEPPPTFAGHTYPGHSVIGGWNVYVNPHSKHIPADLTFIKWITGITAQTYIATHYSEVPTNEAVQSSSAVKAKNPVLAIVHKLRLVSRPSYTPIYPKISSAVYQNINSALAGSVSPSKALSSASSAINTALSSSGL